MRWRLAFTIALTAVTLTLWRFGDLVLPNRDRSVAPDLGATNTASSHSTSAEHRQGDAPPTGRWVWDADETLKRPSSALSSLPHVETSRATSSPAGCIDPVAGTSSEITAAAERATEAAEVPKSRVTNASQSLANQNACRAVATILRDAKAIYHVTDTNAIWYSRGPPPHDPRNVMHLIETGLTASLCTGQQPFDSKAKIEFELVAISADGPAKIFVGDHWVSDGRIVSPLPDITYFDIAGYLKMRAREPGLTRTEFDSKLAANHTQFLPDDGIVDTDEPAPANSTPSCQGAPRLPSSL